MVSARPKQRRLTCNELSATGLDGRPSLPKVARSRWGIVESQGAAILRPDDILSGGAGLKGWYLWVFDGLGRVA